MTPDPNTSAKVSRYKWEAYGDANPREVRDLISKIRSCAVRSDLKNKAFSAVFCAYF